MTEKTNPQPPSPDAHAELLKDLREVVGVLDEPFHHDAIAVRILEAADKLEQQATEIQSLREQNEKLNEKLRRRNDEV